MRSTSVICALSVVFMAACGWVHGDLHKGTPFDAEDLIDGDMGIGGVVVARSLEGRQEEGEDLAKLMRDRILDARQDFKVVSSQSVERYMGAESRRAMLETYGSNQSLPRNVLLEIASDLEDHFRFLALAVVVRDTVLTRIKPRQRPVDSRPSTDYITTREVSATFDVYDLQRLTRAWTIYLTAGADRTLTRRQHEDTPGTLTSSPYPDPISLDRVASFLFDEFAWSLPGYGSSRQNNETPPQ